MHRFTLRELATASPATISAELRSRFALQHKMLAAARVPTALEPALAKLQQSWQAAVDESMDDVSALANCEDGAVAAVEAIRKLPNEERAGDAAQRLMRGAFSAVVGHRALAQASLREADDPLIQPAAELPALLEHLVEDASAFCREKHGDYPEVRVMHVAASGGGKALTDLDSGVLFSPFIAFALHELLKNAMGAHVRSVGADKLDSLRPVEMRWGVREGVAYVGVTDCGGGWAHAPDTAAQFLHTTNPERTSRWATLCLHNRPAKAFREN